MPKKSIREEKLCNEYDIAFAIDDIISGRMTASKAAKFYSIPRSILYDKIIGISSIAEKIVPEEKRKITLVEPAPKPNATIQTRPRPNPSSQTMKEAAMEALGAQRQIISKGFDDAVLCSPRFLTLIFNKREKWIQFMVEVDLNFYGNRTESSIYQPIESKPTTSRMIQIEKDTEINGKSFHLNLNENPQKSSERNLRRMNIKKDMEINDEPNQQRPQELTEETDPQKEINPKSARKRLESLVSVDDVRSSRKRIKLCLEPSANDNDAGNKNDVLSKCSFSATDSDMDRSPSQPVPSCLVPSQREVSKFTNGSTTPLNEPDGMSVKYKIVEGATERKKPRLLDNIGYSYTVKTYNKDGTSTWRCQTRNMNINCPATVKQIGENKFEKGTREHTHVATKYRRVKKSTSLRNLPKVDKSSSEASLVEEAILTGRTPDASLSTNLETSVSPSKCLNASLGEVSKLTNDSKPTRLNEPVETSVKYEIIEGATERNKPRLLDNIGYSYIVKCYNKDGTTTWRCQIRNMNINCPATLKQIGENKFEKGRKDHTHDISLGLSEVVKIKTFIRKQLKENKCSSAASLVKEAMRVCSTPNAPLSSNLKIKNLIRNTNNQRQKDRDIDLNLAFLNFEPKEGLTYFCKADMPIDLDYE